MITLHIDVEEEGKKVDWKRERSHTERI